VKEFYRREVELEYTPTKDMFRILWRKPIVFQPFVKHMKSMSLHGKWYVQMWFTPY